VDGKLAPKEINAQRPLFSVKSKINHLISRVWRVERNSKNGQVWTDDLSDSKVELPQTCFSPFSGSWEPGNCSNTDFHIFLILHHSIRKMYMSYLWIYSCFYLHPWAHAMMLLMPLWGDSISSILRPRIEYLSQSSGFPLRHVVLRCTAYVAASPGLFMY
jgi:hypothetical protein